MAVDAIKRHEFRPGHVKSEATAHALTVPMNAIKTYRMLIQVAIFLD
jgi:hypothetical protein